MEPRIINHIVGKFDARQFSTISREDLLQEAALACIEAEQKIANDEQWTGNAMTYIYSYILWNVRSLILKEAGRMEESLMETRPFDRYADSDTYYEQLDVSFLLSLETLESIAEMGEDVLLMCEYVFENWETFVVMPPKYARGAIKDHFREEGWSWGRIWGTFKKIRGLLTQTSFSLL